MKVHRHTSQILLLLASTCSPAAADSPTRMSTASLAVKSGLSESDFLRLASDCKLNRRPASEELGVYINDMDTQINQGAGYEQERRIRRELKDFRAVRKRVVEHSLVIPSQFRPTMAVGDMGIPLGWKMQVTRVIDPKKTRARFRFAGDQYLDVIITN